MGFIFSCSREAKTALLQYSSAKQTLPSVSLLTRSFVGSISSTSLKIPSSPPRDFSPDSDHPGGHWIFGCSLNRTSFLPKKPVRQPNGLAAWRNSRCRINKLSRPKLECRTKFLKNQIRRRQALSCSLSFTPSAPSAEVNPVVTLQ